VARGKDVGGAGKRVPDVEKQAKGDGVRGAVTGTALLFVVDLCRWDLLCSGSSSGSAGTTAAAGRFVLRL
jgi:hypothetical protein